MAAVTGSYSTWLVSLKVALISTGVLSMAVILKQSVPVISEFAVSGVPVMWSSFRSWMKPPYLYVIINGIIITIAASSKFHQRNQDPPGTVAKDPEEERTEFTYEMSNSPGFVPSETPVVYEQSEVTVSEVKMAVESPLVEDKEELVISRSTTPPPPPPLLRRESSEIPLEYLLSTEKPLASSRIGHRKPVKASSEGGGGKALRVSKTKRHETLENTWKMITDGRHMPLTRHLKKSDTWENHGRHIAVAEDTSSPQRVNKSETFKDRTNNPPPTTTALTSQSPLGSGKLKKERSLSQDELNRRVEAFIKKFNEEMRMQRQESLNQYNEMISRGAQ